MAGRLYPPILDYSMPAFVAKQDTPVRIYFAIPTYNSLSEIGSVHMTVRYLESNENALSSTYPAKIKVAAYETDNERVAQQDRYYIDLSATDLEDGFVTGTIYKIQLRFSKISAENSDSNPGAAWFNSNLASFSEWSTVALIRPIAEPTYDILGLEDANKGASVNFASADAVFTITYSQGESSEPLRSWRTRLYNENKTTLLADSGVITYNNYDYLPVDSSNSITFDSILPYQMHNGESYILQLDLVTRNGYSVSSDYTFTCSPSSSTDFQGTINCDMNEEEGYAEITVQTTEPTNTNIIIRRTSSESSFAVWEDIALKTSINENVNWTFRDFSIESGIWYRYGVQTRDIYGHRGALIELNMTPPQMCEFEHAFLLEEGGRQLKLKYDFQISTANVTVSESKTDTIGSKFPFVRRNGNMYYRTFQCTGLITGFMDLGERLFITPEELFHNQNNLYKNTRDTINLQVNQYDYTYEREFREKVQEFLYDDKVKLFKSLQEGNILVKLMNITLTPKNELGRLLYTFSAQAVEIDEPSLTNLDNYGIQTVDHYASDLIFSENKLGQVSSFNGYNKNGEPKFTTYSANQNILQSIGKQYGWSYDTSGEITRAASNNIVVNSFQLTYLRIEFESDPYLILRNGSSLTPFTGSTTIGQDLILGWLLNIGTETILVQPPNNIYELQEEGLAINFTTQISSPADVQLTVYFLAQLNEEVDTSLIPISTTYYKINGQLNRIFKPNISSEDVFSLLETKYTRNESETEKYTLDALFTADIEAEPGTVLFAQSKGMNNPTKFVINETGNLFLDPGIDGVTIASIKFNGYQIDTRYINNFVINHSKESKPSTAQDYDYYSENGKLHMYYNGTWYDCEQINNYVYEITCPVSAIVNYKIQQKKEVYKRD